MAKTRLKRPSPAKPRTRCGSWRTFERRFRPLDGPDGAPYWRYDQLPTPLDVRRVWTIVDGGNGRLYVSPGLRCVNRLDHLYCAIAWTDDDARQPDFRHD